jgi:hypothetical protein
MYLNGDVLCQKRRLLPYLPRDRNAKSRALPRFPFWLETIVHPSHAQNARVD